MFTSSCGFYKVFGPQLAQGSETLRTAALRLLVCFGAVGRPVNTARPVGTAKARQIPGWVLVDLAFRIEVQWPKLALAHILSQFHAGGRSYYSIRPA